ncbi:hypothetical protein PF008_g5353 [Phytophthora fragariae]|uniref:Uncharacterized protein n=1 Tax=Phytophthora fragariae TaxID=53985 RepID=A0A6G0S981_9STRA|nr:hypothetical protein PF008_g5353 [Phytophthora fragariae]
MLVSSTSGFAAISITFAKQRVFLASAYLWLLLGVSSAVHCGSAAARVALASAYLWPLLGVSGATHCGSTAASASMPTRCRRYTPAKFGDLTTPPLKNPLKYEKSTVYFKRDYLENTKMLTSTRLFCAVSCLDRLRLLIH